MRQIQSPFLLHPIKQNQNANRSWFAVPPLSGCPGFEDLEPEEQCQVDPSLPQCTFTEPEPEPGPEPQPGPTDDEQGEPEPPEDEEESDDSNGNDDNNQESEDGGSDDEGESD